MPAGRPSEYSDETAQRICDLMATSSFGLSRLCDDHPELPHHKTVWRWMHERPEFRAMVLRAREHQADYLVFQAGQILDEADTTSENASAVVHLAKAKADYRLKLAPKIAPRTMSEERRHKISGDPDAPLQTTQTHVEIADILTDEQREQFAELARQALQRGAGK